MKMIAFLIAALAFCSRATAQPLLPLPTTPEGNYAMGQRFANCSARFAHMAFFARRADLPDTVALAEGKARGWKVAGMMFLAQGMSPSRVNETEQTFDALVEVKLMDLKAKAEMDAEAYRKAIPVDFAKECEPLVPTQEKLIELMRRGPQ